MLECAYNRRYLILDAEQYCNHCRNDVVTDKLPAGAAYGVAILAIKTVLCLEPMSGRFQARQDVFSHASDK